MQTAAAILKQNRPQFNTIDANVTVLDAIAIMESEHTSFLIVLENEQYAGIFSERDYIQKITLMNRQSGSTFVKDVLTKNLPTITGNETPMFCMQLMNAHETRYLPVFEDFTFKGIITLNDLMKDSIQK